MITTRDIESFVDLKQGGFKEVFSSIVGSKSKATKNMAMASARIFCQKILETHHGIATPTGTAIHDVANVFSLEDIILLAENEDVKLRNTFRNRFILKHRSTRNLAIRLVAFVYDLNYERLKLIRDTDTDLCYQIGDAIFIAGLYCELKWIQTEK